MSGISEWIRYTYDPSVITEQPTNEVQHISVDATSGTYDLTCLGQTATGIAYSAPAATVKAALVAAGVSTNDITVSGGVGASGGGTPYVVTFVGAQAGKNVTQMTTSSTSLAGGAHTATVSTTTAGGTAVVLHLKNDSGKAAKLPAGAAVLRGYIQPVTDLTSTGTATIKLGIDSADGAFLSATNYNNGKFTVSGAGGFTTSALTWVDGDGDRVCATVADAAITAGKFHLHLEIRH